MPAPPAAYATQSRVRGVQGLQRVRGALQGSPRLPFLTGPPTSAKQVGVPSKCARLLHYHDDGAGVTPTLAHSGSLAKGWGRREGSPLPITALSLRGATRLRASAPY